MRSITKTFPGVKALENVNLDVRRGEIHAICGENGAGKSTLMKVLSGVYPTGSYDGEIVYDGEPVHFGGIRDSEHVGIVIIHQELALVPYLSIAENIFLGNERRGRGGLIDWNLANADAAAAGVGRPGREPGDAGRPARRRQAAAGRDRQGAVQGRAPADPRRADRRAQRQRLRAPARPAAPPPGARHHLDHDLAQAQRDHRDRRPRDRHPRRQDRRDARPWRPARSPRSGSSAAWSAATWRASTPTASPRPGEEVLRVEDWTVWHPTQDRKVVDDASFTVRAGEVVGIAGLMGAGRTELAMSIFGRSYGRDISGRVFIHGKEVKARTVAEAIEQRHRLRHRGPQALRPEPHRGHPAQRLGGRPGQALPPRLGERQRGDQGRRGEPRSMNIKAPSVMSVVGKLSGGNQQKVVLSKWLFTDPDVLILDEPTRGIDVGAKYEIYTIVNQLVAAGKAVVVISSSCPSCSASATASTRLSAGRITGQLPVREATRRASWSS